MFRGTMCPSSGETVVFMRHLLIVTVWMSVWYAGWNSLATLKMQAACSSAMLVSLDCTNQHEVIP